jgi:hypothetical protein
VTLYRSKPTLVEAVQWTGENQTELDTFAPGKTGSNPMTGEMSLLAGVQGAQGWVDVPVGHWIVRNPGEHIDYWPVDPDYFTLKYEPVPINEELT